METTPTFPLNSQPLISFVWREKTSNKSNDNQSDTLKNTGAEWFHKEPLKPEEPHGRSQQWGLQGPDLGKFFILKFKFEVPWMII